jgi:hypothetical protein
MSMLLAGALLSGACTINVGSAEQAVEASATPVESDAQETGQSQSQSQSKALVRDVDWASQLWPTTCTPRRTREFVELTRPELGGWRYEHQAAADPEAGDPLATPWLSVDIDGVASGDVTGDGTQDALFLQTCEEGGNFVSQRAQVWSADSGTVEALPSIDAGDIFTGFAESLQEDGDGLLMVSERRTPHQIVPGDFPRRTTEKWTLEGSMDDWIFDGTDWTSSFVSDEPQPDLYPTALTLNDSDAPSSWPRTVFPGAGFNGSMSVRMPSSWKPTSYYEDEESSGFWPSDSSSPFYGATVKGAWLQDWDTGDYIRPTSIEDLLWGRQWNGEPQVEDVRASVVGTVKVEGADRAVVVEVINGFGARTKELIMEAAGVVVVLEVAGDDWADAGQEPFSDPIWSIIDTFEFDASKLPSWFSDKTERVWEGD